MLGCEVRVRVNSASLMAVVRDVEAGLAGEPVASGFLDIELLSSADGFTLFADGAEVHRGRRAVDMAGSLDSLIVRKVVDRTGGLTRMRAGFARVTGKNILLAGLRRSGRTALLLELMVRGAAIRSEDVLLVEDGPSVPLPRRFRVRDEMLAHLPELQESCLNLNRYPSDSGGTVFYFDPTVAGMAWEATRGKPDLILCLEPAGAKETITGEGGSVAIASRLLPITDFTGEPQRHFRRMMALVDSCPSHLLVAEDLKTAAASVLRLCSGL